MSAIEEQYKSPVRKILAWLESSRDRWKVKYASVKSQLRKTENQVRAVEDSRETWRRRAEAAEGELRELKKTGNLSS